MASVSYDLKNLGPRLRQLRQKRGVTQEVASAFMDVNRPQLGKYERNQATPSLKTLLLIADYYEVSLDYLFTGGD